MPTVPRTAGALAAAAALVLLAAGPASAHDRLERTDPVDHAQLAAPPAHVSLTFEEPVGQRFSVVAITGPDGQSWSSGPSAVTGNVVTQPLRPGAPAGAYTMAYRVVSADGHPVSGRSTFTAAAASPAQVAPPSPVAAGSASAAAGATAVTTPSPAAAGGGDARVTGLGHLQHHGVLPEAGVLALAAVLAGVVWAVDRRRHGAIAAPHQEGRP